MVLKGTYMRKYHTSNESVNIYTDNILVDHLPLTIDYYLKTFIDYYSGYNQFRTLHKKILH